MSASVIDFEEFRETGKIVEFKEDIVGDFSDIPLGAVTTLLGRTADASEQVLAMTTRLNHMNRTIVTLRRPFSDEREVISFKNTLHRQWFIDPSIADADGKEFIHPHELVGVKTISVAHDVADFIIRNLMAIGNVVVEAEQGGITLVKHVLPADNIEQVAM